MSGVSACPAGAGREFSAEDSMERFFLIMNLSCRLKEDVEKDPRKPEAHRVKAPDPYAASDVVPQSDRVLGDGFGDAGNIPSDVLA